MSAILNLIMPLTGELVQPDTLLAALRAWLNGFESPEVVPPQHRVRFQWPPHPVSADFHVLTSDWTGETEFEAYGQKFKVRVARTPYGVFGRSDELWAEARGKDESEMLEALGTACQPLFERQLAIGSCLGSGERFTKTLRELGPLELLKLLYCPNRDVASEAQVEIETHASLQIFGPALIEILRDTRHPHRRSAQWCVLDLFEDLPSFCPSPEQQDEAIQAIRDLIWGATDDFARTIYKAGVVLGGHICSNSAARALLDCLNAPSRFGRRAAIHASFHLAEWMPELRQEIAEAIIAAAKQEPEPALKIYAPRMAEDIKNDEPEHVMEPVFDEEA